VAGRLKLGQILVNRGLLHPDQLAAALADQQETGARLGMTLVRLGFVDEETLIRALAGQLKLPVARIRGKRVSADVLECVRVELAEKHRCLPLFFKQEGGERVLFVAMEDPSDSEALDELARESGQVLRAVLVGPTELEEALQRHYHWTSLTGELFEWDAPGSGAGAPVPAAPADSATESESPPAASFDPDPDEAPPDPDPQASFDLRHASYLGHDPDLELGSDPEPGSALDVEFEAEPVEPLGSEDPDEALWADDLGEADTAPDLADPVAAAEVELEVDDETAVPEADWDLAPEDPAAAGAAPRRLRPDSLDPSIILRALSQLLVEKGVISRDEFVQRLGEIAAREGSE
jgi:type IV pilus assembly protein PilB